MNTNYRLTRLDMPFRSTKVLKSVIVLALAITVFGGGAYLACNVLDPYRALAGLKVPSITYKPPIAVALENARKLHAAGKLAEAQQLLRKQLRIYPRRPEAKDARELLGDIDTEMFFSTAVPFGKTEYVVRRGDTLWRIAHKLDSTPAAIMRTNSMKSDRLQPGDKLLVPNLDFTVTLDLPNERAVVHSGDAFFKQYPIAAINLPRRVQRSITTKVSTTSFWKDGKRLVHPTEAERAESTPWVYLGSGDYILYGVSEEEGVADETVELAANNSAATNSAANTDPDTPPRGIALLKEDLAELQLLIDRGTPVTIVSNK